MLIYLHRPIENPKNELALFFWRARPCRHEMEAQRKAARIWTMARKEEARLA
jgi:hypothetical protein